MPYDMNNRDDMDNRRTEDRPRNNEGSERRPARSEMGMTSGQQRRAGITRNAMKGMSINPQEIEEIYDTVGERMCLATDFHSQLADFFCFLGLQGFKRMCEYQYMKECAGLRKVHRRYIDHHHRVIPPDSGVYAGEKPDIIPDEWTRYTTQDIDDSVIPKFVRMALTKYYKWEMETKEILTEQCERLMAMNAYADYEYLKELLQDVEKEIKKVMRLYERLNGTGYDVTAIHGMQDTYHEKYKKKYDDHFTTKNNRAPMQPWDDGEDRPYRSTRIGY